VNLDPPTFVTGLMSQFRLHILALRSKPAGHMLASSGDEAGIVLATSVRECVCVSVCLSRKS